MKLFSRMLWILGVATLTWCVVAWTLAYYQYSLYMEWNISHTQPDPQTGHAPH